MRFHLLPLALLPALASPVLAQTATSFEMFADSTRATGTAIAAGDFNQDGKPDYVTGGQPMTLRLGNGDGTFQPAISFGTAGGSPSDIAVADVNQDGHLDVVAGSFGTVTVYFGNGDGTFQTGTPISFSSATNESLAIGDFNSDGLIDIAVGLSNGSVAIYNNLGGINFRLARTINVVSPPYEVVSVRAGDVDGNGTVDLAVGTNSAAYVLWGDGKDGFTPVLLKSYPNGNGVFAFTSDLNQDSHPDIIVYNNCSDSQPAGHSSGVCATIDAFYGGQGTQKTFYRNVGDQLNLATYVADIRAVDINGDGIGDLAISGRDQNGSQEGMFFFLGNPDGSFPTTPERYIATSDGVANFALADFNRDGMMDAVEILDSGGTTELYLNATQRPPCATSAINPTVTVCAPVDGTYTNSPVTIQATTYDTNTVTALQLYQDGSLVYNQPVTTFNLTRTASVGQHLFVTKAFDYTGTSFRSDRTINVYSGTPGAVCTAAAGAAAICLPAATSGSPIHIVANANTPAVPTAAQLYIDGSLIINNATSSTALDTTTTLTPGSHLLVFKLFDANGNVAMASKTVTVN